MKIAIGPAQGSLEDIVETTQREGAWDLDQPPNGRTNLLEGDPEFVNVGLTLRFRCHLYPCRSEAGSERASLIDRPRQAKTGGVVEGGEQVVCEPAGVIASAFLSADLCSALTAATGYAPASLRSARALLGARLRRRLISEEKSENREARISEGEADLPLERARWRGDGRVECVPVTDENHLLHPARQRGV